MSDDTRTQRRSWRTITALRPRDVGLLEEHERDGTDAATLLFMARDMASANLTHWRAN